MQGAGIDAILTWLRDTLWGMKLTRTLMAVVCGALLLAATDEQPAQPKVLGIAHYSIFVSDLAKARAFV